jgi:hypothetical protein
MSAGGILFLGVLLCLACIAGIGIYFEMASSKRRRLAAVSYGFGRRSRPRHPKTRR